MENNRALTHFGTVGMRWGIRRQEKKSSNSSTSPKKEKWTKEQKVHAGKVIGASILGTGLGAFSFRAVAGMTDLAASPTAMYVATLMGGAFGANAALSLFD